MSAKRSLVIALAVILIAAFLVGCSPQTQDATFIGYKRRPANETDTGIAIIQLGTGMPVEAECRYQSLENGTPIKVEKTGDSYKVVSSSPDWTP